jgi:hypothetical protein
MGQRTWNSTISYDFSKFILSVREGTCDCSLQAPKYIAMPLVMCYIGFIMRNFNYHFQRQIAQATTAIEVSRIWLTSWTVSTHDIWCISVDTVLQESPYEPIIRIKFLEIPTRNDYMIKVLSQKKRSTLIICSPANLKLECTMS